MDKKDNTRQAKAALWRRAMSLRDAQRDVQLQYGCADWSKEHSGATRDCTWLAILRMDYHSLSRQRSSQIMSLLRERLLHAPTWNAKSVLAREGQIRFLVRVLAMAHSTTERCRRAQGGPGAALLPFAPLIAGDVTDRAAGPSPRTPLGSSGLTSAGMSALPPCGPLSTFDTRLLPYRWLPGMAPPAAKGSAMSLSHAMSAQRFEVMHIADYWPGAVWLYWAPGSGVWWSPGRRVVANNLVDALLKTGTAISTIARHLDEIERGDRRINRFRAWMQWRAAYGADTPWEVVLAGAAAGNATHAMFASAGELLGSLLTERPPEGVDSIILREQTHFWPRGAVWDILDDGYAPAMVSPCPSESKPALLSQASVACDTAT